MSEKYNRLLEKIIQFRDDRDWEQFHTPKNLAISITIEAAELLEHFQWTDGVEVGSLDIKKRTQIADEIADIGNYLMLLCNAMGLDLYNEIERKIEINAEKYPVHKAKGTPKKYSEL